MNWKVEIASYSRSQKVASLAWNLFKLCVWHQTKKVDLHWLSVPWRWEVTRLPIFVSCFDFICCQYSQGDSSIAYNIGYPYPPVQGRLSMFKSVTYHLLLHPADGKNHVGTLDPWFCTSQSGFEHPKTHPDPDPSPGSFPVQKASDCWVVEFKVRLSQKVPTGRMFFTLTSTSTNGEGSSSGLQRSAWVEGGTADKKDKVYYPTGIFQLWANFKILNFQVQEYPRDPV